MQLSEAIKNVQTKSDFISFIDLIIMDYKTNEQEWENKNIEEYLASIKSWVEDMEWYYKNTNQALPNDINWNVFSNIIYAGKIYE